MDIVNSIMCVETIPSLIDSKTRSKILHLNPYNENCRLRGKINKYHRSLNQVIRANLEAIRSCDARVITRQNGGGNLSCRYELENHISYL